MRTNPLALFSLLRSPSSSGIPPRDPGRVNLCQKPGEDDREDDMGGEEELAGMYELGPAKECLRGENDAR